MTGLSQRQCIFYLNWYRMERPTFPENSNQGDQAFEVHQMAKFDSFLDHKVEHILPFYRHAKQKLHLGFRLCNSYSLVVIVMLVTKM